MSSATRSRDAHPRGNKRKRIAPETPASEVDDSDHDTGDGEWRETARRKKAQYDSDALDEDSDVDQKIVKPRKSSAKGKAATSTASATTRSRQTAPRKKRKSNGDGDGESDNDLQPGQEIVGVVVQAPKTGRVPPGQISRNTLDFLNHLKDPACNDRKWFRLHEPVYRVAEKEWKDFIDSFTEILVEVDAEIPPLPPKDVIHRIYRDIRFSNDKTPYKKGLSASFSRSGRKGIFAGYHIAVKPGNESIIAAGLWCPGRAELANVRINLQRDSTSLRRVISSPKFVKYFGKAEPHAEGQKQNIFGMEDELKVAPKGIEKAHKDIDLLKCRSFAVVHQFTDSEVLDPDFKHALAEVAKVMQPFVHVLNDLITVGGGTNNNGEAEGNADEEEQDHVQDDEEPLD